MEQRRGTRRASKRSWGAVAGPALLLGALLAAAPCDAQDAAGLARQHHQRGVDLFEAGRYDDALAELRAALALYPSPNTLLYVARSLQGTGRLDEAATEFDRAYALAAADAQSDPRYTATREAARTERAALAPRVGSVRLALSNAPAQSRVRVDGRVVDAPAPGQPIVVMPHAVTLEVDAPGFFPLRRVVVVEAGGVATVAVALVPVAAVGSDDAHRDLAHTSRPRGLGATFGVGLGVGIAGAAAGGTFLGLAEGQFATLSHDCGACTTESTRAGRAFEVGMYASFALGVAGLVTAAVDAIVERAQHAHDAPARRAARE